MKEKHFAEEMHYMRYRPTFWGGFSSLFDLESNLRYQPDTTIDHQRTAWLLVGKCMWGAIEQIEEETGIRILDQYGHRPELVSHD